jgi:hypothetical protein
LLWNELKKEHCIKLPLVKWGQAAEAPVVLKSYLVERRDYIELFNIYDGTINQEL